MNPDTLYILREEAKELMEITQGSSQSERKNPTLMLKHMRLRCLTKLSSFGMGLMQQQLLRQRSSVLIIVLFPVCFWLRV